ATQRNATQRNATQRNATQRNATQRNATLYQENQSNTINNRIIHGDNLTVLKSLLPEFEGKVNCIYIDPPYNTGNEGWIYNDNVNDPRIIKWLGDVVGKEGEDLSRHDKWLCMMYPRLKLLHRLLADDGVIFISIDDNEQSNLKLICDEIFGYSNFITNIIWEKNYSPRNDTKYFSSSHDFIVVYQKNKDQWKRNLAPRTEKQNKFYKYNDNDGRGLWRPDNVLVKSFSQAGVFGITNPNTEEVHFPPKGSCYRFNEEKAKKLLEENKFYFGKDGRGKPQLKRYLSEVNDGVVPQTLWKHEEVSHSQEGKKEINSIIEGNVFDTPKPSRLIERILQIATNPTSIVLDSFAGSGTTAHAVLKLNAQDGGNRRFILCEMMDYAESITAERVRRVMEGYGEGNKKVEGLGGSFDFYELGDALFSESGLLNESVGIKRIRQYIAYSESIPLDNQLPIENEISPSALGLNQQTLWLFHYNKDAITSLDLDFLGTLNLQNIPRPSQFVVYADKCVLDDKFMQKHGITFKRIPRDIMRF
ncbi:site-specific DNA-methyltransferase, partial [Acinetobacter baumannii]|uniref:site-specific DNA-methyltransferase n=1 Tax=Acinetobacter baumannii TaxID=470 RepID=UPI001D187647